MPKFPSGPSGHVPISYPSTPQRRADQLSGCPAVARRLGHRGAVRSLDRQPRPPTSGGAARQEAAAQELPLDDETPASTASAVNTTRTPSLTSYHSAKTLKSFTSVETICGHSKLFQFSDLRTMNPLLPLVTGLLGLGRVSGGEARRPVCRTCIVY
jgi:hypothetical protein